MAVRKWNYEQIHAGLVIATVTGLLNGDLSDALQLAPWADKTFEVHGTMGVGGTVAIKGANVDRGAVVADWKDMHKADTGAETMTALLAADVDELISPIENPKFIQAFVTAGDGTTNVTIVVTAATPR